MITSIRLALATAAAGLVVACGTSPGPAGPPAPEPGTAGCGIAMRAFQLIEWQKPPELREVPVPEPAPGQVLVKVDVDHVTVYRWVQRFTPLFIDAARPCRHAAGDRWFVDETYVKVAGRWIYLYRAVDQFGQVIDVLASQSETWRQPAGSSLVQSSTHSDRPR